MAGSFYTFRGLSEEEEEWEGRKRLVLGVGWIRFYMACKA